MYYEVNVFHKNIFLFATSKDSVESQPELVRLLTLFAEKFPESEGYRFVVYRKEVVHNDSTVNINAIMQAVKDGENIPA